MQIDPQNERYGEIYAIDEEREKELMPITEEPNIVSAISHSKDQLEKLQADLRKAGYRKQNR